MDIRAERPGDHDAVREVHRRAFVGAPFTVTASGAVGRPATAEVAGVPGASQASWVVAGCR